MWFVACKFGFIKGDKITDGKYHTLSFTSDPREAMAFPKWEDAHKFFWDSGAINALSFKNSWATILGSAAYQLPEAVSAS